MEKFVKRLENYIEESKLTKEALNCVLGFAKSSSIISSWINRNNIPSLENSIKLANYFNCSLDYLFGLTENDEEVKFKTSKPFSIQLRKILEEKDISQNKLMRETKFGSGHLYSWFKLNAQPNMETVIELAKYLKVSLDYLAGRE